MTTTVKDGGEGRVLIVGQPDESQCDNSVQTSKYTFWSFLPVAIGEQFRRKGNVYFLVMGMLMMIGYYGTYFDSVISPWTTLGPLAIVISISLIQEGAADLARHRSDALSNRYSCTILERVADSPQNPNLSTVDQDQSQPTSRQRSRRDSFVVKVCAGDTDIESGAAGQAEESKDIFQKHVNIRFKKVPRRDIRVGHLVLVRNRDMIPADLVLLASSGDDGGAYIETSSIDGETNLKLRTSAKPAAAAQSALAANPLSTSVTSGPSATVSASVEAKSGAFKNEEEKEELDVQQSVSFEEDAIVQKPTPLGTTEMIISSKFEKASFVAENKPSITMDSADSCSASFVGEDSSTALEPHGSFGSASTEHRKRGSALKIGKYSPQRQEARGNASANKSAKPETIEEATKRITNTTYLGAPDGKSAQLLVTNARDNQEEGLDCDNIGGSGHGRRSSVDQIIYEIKSITSMGKANKSDNSAEGVEGSGMSIKIERYVAALTCEEPNASVNTFSGKLTLPPAGIQGMPVEIPLNAENFLLRGAFLRNTEWAIGVACFTGKETKLVKNSSSPPSRLSQLDKLVNRTIIVIVCVMMTCVLCLSLYALYTGMETFDTTWYLAFQPEERKSSKWPYLTELAAPTWAIENTNFIQNVFLFTILLNNFVPLSLYITMELVTRAMMLFINADLNMYHKETDTPAVARSTTVTDLGQIRYIFSDKTGTLTQNVMRFKRCSVDGMMFGAPVLKYAPSQLSQDGARHQETNTDYVPPRSFHPLKRLLVGAGSIPADGAITLDSSGRNLTFNAEMFLRVMSICHTVVVERDHDASDDLTVGTSGSKTEWISNSLETIGAKMKVKRKKYREQDLGLIREDVSEMTKDDDGEHQITTSQPDGSIVSGLETPNQVLSRMWSSSTMDTSNKSGMGPGGAPLGESYQAESPDEGALVTAASLIYGFQLLGRDSSGVRLSCSSPSLLQHDFIAEGLKGGKFTAKSLASASVSPAWDEFLSSAKQESNKQNASGDSDVSSFNPREEVWDVLAVNKFDSTRKRMSVLVRSPPELGSLPMLFCKGADSSMLDSGVCEGGEILEQESHNDCRQTDEDEFQVDALLAIHSHLGDFASEGLRTLVLGVRVLDELECKTWLSRYVAAAGAIKEREKKLKSLATEIERDLHIVGVTAIEDKLQDGVPHTISNLARAGIKLWVLTGDKRETAIEIGYSTKVLTPSMNLFQVAASDGGGGARPEGSASRIRTIVANEFIKLVKTGELPQYQHSVLNKRAKPTLRHQCRDCLGVLGRWWKLYNRAVLKILCEIPCNMCGRRRRSMWDAWDTWDADTEGEDEDEDERKLINEPGKRRRQVRKLAEEIISSYLNGQLEKNVSAARNEQRDVAGDDHGSCVFNRAASAKARLEKHRHERGHSTLSLRSLSIASVTSRGKSVDHIVDEDALSLLSFFPEDYGSTDNIRDLKRPSRVLERLFAVDSDVRHGRLVKHHLRKQKKEQVEIAAVKQNGENGPLKNTETIEIITGVAEGNCVEEEEKEREEVESSKAASHEMKTSSHGPKALIIEGAALLHLLGNPLLEEMLFAVASCCDAVIACRVSPRQKALLVKMVRTYVSPVPMTLAIGDGANDVGMIQEAHVGVGISGLEGQQAVNSSDFAIAQFRYLEELLLVHGRSNFTRMARVVLFSFYKNAVMAGLMVVYNGDNLYSGTPLFNEWVISMFNFVCSFPIFFIGLFDRDFERGYVKKNPELYAAGAHNEELSLRKVWRWVAITLIQLFTMYYFSLPILSLGGEATSAWKGLMFNESQDFPGDGQGDYYTFGTTIYTVLVFTLAYKALYETRAIINGQVPPCECFSRKKHSRESCWSRLPYTWIGVSLLSVLFYLGALFLYEAVAKNGNENFSAFTGAATHTFLMRALTWMVTLVVPVVACFFDVTFKVFANFYFPTQTQIHMEIASKEKANASHSNADTRHIKAKRER